LSLNRTCDIQEWGNYSSLIQNYSTESSKQLWQQHFIMLTQTGYTHYKFTKPQPITAILKWHHQMFQWIMLSVSSKNSLTISTGV
jgi:hypothetical protein